MPEDVAEQVGGDIAALPLCRLRGFGSGAQVVLKTLREGKSVLLREEQGRGRPLTCGNAGAPERIRTSDTWFRKPLLYPLSYGSPAEAVGPLCRTQKWETNEYCEPSGAPGASGGIVRR